MDTLRFAVCIALHGATAADIVAAAMAHQVHILDKTSYSPLLNYNSVIEEYNSFNPPIAISLLFVFPDEESILLSKDDNIRQILESMDLSRYINPLLN